MPSYSYAYGTASDGTISISVTLHQTYQVADWGLVEVGFQQRSDRDTQADVEWARSVMRNGMPFPPGRTENLKQVMGCYNKWKFSSTIAGLVGEQYRGIAEAFEIGSLLSLGSDIAAVIKKSRRRGALGSREQWASGMNKLFREIGKTLNLPSTVRKGLKSFGRGATPTLAIVGAFVAGYNASVFAQCLSGDLK